MIEPTVEALPMETWPLWLQTDGINPIGIVIIEASGQIPLDPTGIPEQFTAAPNVELIVSWADYLTTLATVIGSDIASLENPMPFDTFAAWFDDYQNRHD